MRTLSTVCAWMELVGLSVLVGGMLIIGVLVAPVVFDHLPPMQSGGEVMTAIFRRFNSVVAFICLGLIIVGFLGKLGGLPRRQPGVRGAIAARYAEGGALLLLLSVGLYLGAYLTPQMSKLREMRLQDPANQAVVEQFNLYHDLSETLFAINLLLGLIVLYSNAAQITHKRPEG